ncbi:hypothetical protein C8R44DRAFT_734856 [Mycena epipterygia]|nr:hypothetical protein C8R44DRAFT_734856 [Mycena epipterygia]
MPVRDDNQDGQSAYLLHSLCLGHHRRAMERPWMKRPKMKGPKDTPGPPEDKSTSHCSVYHRRTTDSEMIANHPEGQSAHHRFSRPPSTTTEASKDTQYTPEPQKTRAFGLRKDVWEDSNHLDGKSRLPPLWLAPSPPPAIDDHQVQRYPRHKKTWHEHTPFGSETTAYAIVRNAAKMREIYPPVSFRFRFRYCQVRASRTGF